MSRSGQEPTSILSARAAKNGTRHWCRPHEPSPTAWVDEARGELTDPLFPTVIGRSLSRDAIERRLTCHLSVAAETAYEISRLLGEWRVAGNTLHDRSSARRTLSNHGHRLLEDQVIGRSGSESGGVVDRLDDPGRLDVGTTGRAPSAANA